MATAGNLEGMDIPKIYISFKGDTDTKKDQASLSDDPSEVRRISQAIEKGNEIWRSWCITVGGDLISLGGDEGRVCVFADHIEDLQAIQERYAHAVDAPVSIGIGLKLSEADKALLVSKLHGTGRITFYTPECEEELHQAQEETPGEIHNLGKAEGDVLVHPLAGQFEQVIAEQEQAEAAKQQAAEQSTSLGQMKAQVVSILQAVRANTKELEGLKGEAPHLYQSIQSLVQALIMMGRQLSSQPQPQGDLVSGGKGDNTDPASVDQKQLQEGAQEEADEHTDNPKIAQEIALDHLTEDPKYYKSLSKAEAAPKAKHFIMHYPIGFLLSPGPGTQNPRHGGRIKVAHSDGKTSWVSVRSGMVQGPDGAPASSRNPSGGAGE